MRQFAQSLGNNFTHFSLFSRLQVQLKVRELLHRRIYGHIRGLDDAGSYSSASQECAALAGLPPLRVHMERVALLDVARVQWRFLAASVSRTPQELRPRDSAALARNSPLQLDYGCNADSEKTLMPAPGQQPVSLVITTQSFSFVPDRYAHSNLPVALLIVKLPSFLPMLALVSRMFSTYSEKISCWLHASSPCLAITTQSLFLTIPPFPHV